MNDERKGLPSASAMARIADCPGSLELCKGLESPETEYSKRGTRIHDLIAWISRDMRATEPAPPHMPEELEVAEKLHAKAEELGQEYFDDPEAFPDGGWWERTGRIDETRLWSDSLGMSGKPDRVYDSGDSVVGLLIVDFKTGWGDVPESADNLQLRALAVLAKEQPKWAMVDNIAVAIVTPSDTTLCLYGRRDLVQARDEIAGILERARAPGAPLVPGERQCKYCPAFGVCPAVRAQCDEVMVVAHGQTIPLAEQSNDAIQWLRERAPVIRRLLDDNDAELAKRVEAEPEVWEPRGWVLAPGSERRKVRDVAAVAERVNALGVPWLDIQGRCSIPIGAVEDLLREAGLRGAELRHAVDSVLAGAVEVTTTKPTLKRAKALPEPT